MVKRTARDIRRRNRFDALRCVYAAQAAVTRQDIAEATGLSFATVANLVAELLEAEVLVEAGHEESGGGRPRARLAVNAERGALIGIDVAETSIRLDLFDLALRTLQSVDVPLPTRDERAADGPRSEAPPADIRPSDVVDGIVAGAEELLAAADTAPQQVLGTGVSVPGLVEREGGVSVYSPYWAWRDVPLRALLAERLDMPLYLDNPLKASTVGEMWFGAGREVEDLVVVTLRAGVGVGMAVGGALYRGTTNSAGEWGHTCLIPDGRECRCGNRGCVEAYISTAGIAQTARERATPGSRLLEAPDEETVVRNLGRAAAEGDPFATEVIAATAGHLGVAVANLVNLFNPEVLVLGGSTVDALGEPLLKQTRDVIERHTLPQTLRAVRLSLSTITVNPVSLGAATFGLEGFLNDRETFGPMTANRRNARPSRTPETGRAPG
ncbi:ROK family protein [Streptomyces sp. NBC_00885]|uniref:ROK family protein n=1 Tax=Streptomyces sp. NBC_00885 TaxID=2975857 RepID=UPI0038689744|nr:ROK family protein [Streptomyces sp. NBC_00885]